MSDSRSRYLIHSGSIFGLKVSKEVLKPRHNLKKPGGHGYIER